MLTAVRRYERLIRTVKGVVILITWFTVPAVSQEAVSQQTTDVDGRISVDVSLVQLHATIRKSNGQPVAGLTKDDVRVFENGVAEEIRYFEQEDVPITAGILVDHSGSMGPKIAQAISGANAFASQSNPQDQIFVVNFNEQVSLGLPAGMPFTSDPEALSSAVRESPTTGETALYDAIREGLKHLAKGNYDKKVLIVISDGGDNASRQNAHEILDAVGKSDAIIYCIGLIDETDLHPNPGFLRKLAHGTGGIAFFPTEDRQVSRICESIARDIRAQYVIGYKPSNNKQDGTYRTLRVVARSPKLGKLEVRTRAGYYATAKDR